ncbi:DUF983 domain-containing protein [Rhodovibrionaceae bacterium A322]
MADQFYPEISPTRTGLACRCPRCGQGRLYDGLLSVKPRCEVCDFDLAEADSGDGPAVFIMFILGALVVPLALWMDSAFSPPVWVHALVWGPVIIGGSVILLRPLKALMIALQYKHRASDSGKVNYDPDSKE